jgi:DNA replication protein DnaC
MHPGKAETTMTPEEAQAVLDKQRKEKGIPETAESVEELASSVFSRIRQSLVETPEADAARAKDEQQRRENRILFLKGRWNAPRRHADRQGLWNDDWKQRLEQIKAKLGTGMLIGIAGPNGPGKTQLGVELMRFNIEKHMRSSVYATAMEMFMRIKSVYRKDARETEESMMECYAQPSLLVVDEVGKRADTTWENNVLFEIIDRRYRNMLDTLLLSNQSSDEFAASIGPGLSSRLNETGGIITADWGSFRETVRYNPADRD